MNGKDLFKNRSKLIEKSALFMKKISPQRELEEQDNYCLVQMKTELMRSCRLYHLQTPESRKQDSVSSGMKQRLGILATALLGEPELLILE
ncbi:MAG: hypothetical protein ACLUR5_04940 [Eubacterium ventriosum]